MARQTGLARAAEKGTEGMVLQKVDTRKAANGASREVAKQLSKTEARASVLHGLRWSRTLL